MLAPAGSFVRSKRTSPDAVSWPEEYSSRTLTALP
jgi:hypothetical protein